jgi:pyoverdine/dityrosine biosynthesis protein Dit1
MFRTFHNIYNKEQRKFSEFPSFRISREQMESINKNFNLGRSDILPRIRKCSEDLY